MVSDLYYQIDDDDKFSTHILKIMPREMGKLKIHSYIYYRKDYSEN